MCDAVGIEHIITYKDNFGFTTFDYVQFCQIGDYAPELVTHLQQSWELFQVAPPKGH